MEIHEAIRKSTLGPPGTEENGISSHNGGRRLSLYPPSSNTRRRSSCIAIRTAPSEVLYDVCASEQPRELWELYHKLNELWSDEDPCDISIFVDGQEISAHKVVLSAYSPYFRAMFTGGLAESDQDQVELREVDPSATENIVSFAYSGRLSIKQENVQELLQASSLLQVPAIQSECCRFLYNELDPDNCLGIAQFAELYACFDLANRAFEYAKLHFAQVMGCEEFYQLTTDSLITLLESPYLFAEDESVVLQAVKSWRDDRISERMGSFGAILNRIQLCQIPEVLRANDTLDDEVNVIRATRPGGIKKEGVLWEQPRQHLREMLITVGGLMPSGIRKGDTELYDPQKDKWTSLPHMPVKRSALAMETLDNLLYISGGTDGQKVLCSVQRFCPYDLKWSLDICPMRSTRSYHALVAYSGVLFAVGGQNKNYEVLDSVEAFDPGQSRWISMPCMKSKRRCAGATVLDQVLYVCGGHDGLVTLNLVERYDSRTQQWDMGPRMLSPRSDLGCCVMDGFLYAIGGSRKDHTSCERYSVARGWEPISAMLTHRPHGPISAKIIGSDIFVFGGSDRNVGSILEKYNPSNKQWTLCASLDTNRCDTGLAVLKISAFGDGKKDEMQNENIPVQSVKLLS